MIFSLVDTDTEEVCTHPEDIIEDHIYVACNKGRRYIPKTYSKDGRKNFVVIPSPRPLQYVQISVLSQKQMRTKYCTQKYSVVFL